MDNIAVDSVIIHVKLDYTDTNICKIANVVTISSVTKFPTLQHREYLEHSPVESVVMLMTLSDHVCTIPVIHSLIIDEQGWLEIPESALLQLISITEFHSPSGFVVQLHDAAELDWYNYDKHCFNCYEED